MKWDSKDVIRFLIAILIVLAIVAFSLLDNAVPNELLVMLSGIITYFFGLGSGNGDSDNGDN